MGSRPLVYMWNAIYNDGSKLPQYDSINGEVKIFDNISINKLIKLDLQPFTKSHEEVFNKDDNIELKSIPFLPSYSILIKDDRRPIYYRDVYISQEQYHLCNECKKEFVYTDKSPRINSKYPSPICPHCGSHDYLYCPKDDKKYVFEETANGLCPICKGHLQNHKITSEQHSRERRWIEYIIGAQQTINGKNTQFKLRIDEYGNCKVE